MNLLYIPKGWSSVEYHRLILPFKYITNTQITQSLSEVSVKGYLDSNVSQLWFNRNLSEIYDPEPTFTKLKIAGVKIVIDIDDYWDLPKTHILKATWDKSNISNLYADQIMAADYVVTTHSHLADVIIKELRVKANKIVIASNAIDPTEKQYNREFDYNLTELYWQGSVTHRYDLQQIAKAVSGLEGISFTLAGYNYDSGGEWQLIADDFNIGKRLKTIESKPCDDYMDGYDGKGICLIPLIYNKFNRCKSNLKLLEAGWASKPVVVSNWHPYLPLAKDKINCLVANTEADWHNAIKYLLNNHTFADELRQKLHRDVKRNYTLDTCNKARIDLVNHLNK